MNPYLLLAVAEGCGPGMIPALLDPEANPATLLADPPRLPPAAAARLGSPRLHHTAADWVERATALGQAIVTPGDEAYPDRLRLTPLRPNALFARGDLSLLQSETASLAIVGSRTNTAYGDAATRDFAGAAARAKVAIWSGLAYGVDRLSHCEALAADSPTVAVLAGGLDRIYPERHRELADRIVTGGGLVLSEAPPGVRARRGHFPRRNRILAGCVNAVLVVEAGLQSGTLHTAKFAVDFGVPVFAVPGPYTSPRSVGCHSLIADGAHIAASPEELLRDLGVVTALRQPGQDERALECSADEEAVLRVLRAGPRPTDLVAQQSRLTQARFLESLMSLLRKGRLRQMPGDLLVLV